MKFAISISLVFWVSFSMAQSPITAGEYFIDIDPGVGNATALSLSPGESISLDFGVPLGALSTGSHYLHIRVKNGEDKWSLYARKPFFVTGIESSANIVAAEYFFDADPGIGNATAISVVAGAEISESFAIPLDGLESGIHYLHLRVKNSEDKWSLYARKLFYISPDLGDPIITSAEYFIDVDPGLGNGIPVAVTPGQSITAAFEIATSDMLAEGDHIIHLRIKTDVEKWSLYAKSPFTVDNDIGISEIENNLRIYPNPTAGKINIESDQFNIESVVAIDMKGQVVEHNTQRDLPIDLGDLPPGDYLLRLKFADGSGFSKRIVKL